MKTIDVFEAKSRFSALIRDVECGEAFVVTKMGEPVAAVFAGPAK